MKTSFCLFCSVLGITSATIPLSSSASELNTTLTSANVDLFDLSIEELLSLEVNTRKTKESFADLPLASTVKNQQQLDEANIRSIYQLAEFVPNFSYRPSFGKLQERGVTRGVANASGENVTGIFIDGLSMIGVINELDISDYQYAEVVKGPQASLYGRSTFAGAVNLVVSNPLDDLRKQVQLSHSDTGESRIKGYLGHRVNQDLALQVYANRLYKKGLFDNKTGDGGGSLDETSKNIFRLTSAYRSDVWDATVSLNQLSSEEGALSVTLQGADSNNCFLETSRQYYCGNLQAPKEIGFNNTFLARQAFSGYKNDVTWATFKSNMFVDEMHTVSLDGAINDVSQRYYVDGDYSTANVFLVDIRDGNKTSEVELKLNSNWSESVSSLFGVSSYRKAHTRRSTSFLAASNPPLPLSSRDETNKVDNLAFFMSVNFVVDEQLDFTVDLRHAKDHISFNNTEVNGSQDYFSNAPKLTARYRPNDNSTLYASYSESTKPGGFNVRLWSSQLDNIIDQPLRNRLLAFEPETLSQLEFGGKSLLFDNTLSVAVNAFVGQWRDLQTTQSVSFATTEGNDVAYSVVNNEGKTDTFGVEFEANKQFTDTVSGWLSVGSVTTEIKDSSTAAQEQLFGDGSIDGNKVPNVPEHTAALGFDYRRQIAGWHYHLYSSYSFESERFVAEHNLAKIPDVQRLKLGVNVYQGNWQVSLHSSLADDSYYIESAARLGDPTSGFRLRAFGLTLSDKNSTTLQVTYRM